MEEQDGLTTLFSSLTRLIQWLFPWLVSVFWATTTPAQDPLCIGKSLSMVKGELLYSYQDPRWICSPNGLYRLGLTETGDLTIWKNGIDLHWSGFTVNPEPVFLLMQGDGNLVILESSDRSLIWSSSTSGYSDLDVQLVVTNDGIGQITPVADASRILWQSVGCGQWPDRDKKSRVKGFSSSSSFPLVDTSTLFGKVVVGYIGWHQTSCTGQWRGWSNQRPPGPQTYDFELWPAMDEYDSSSLCETDLYYSDGSVASLYSSYDWRSVDTHMRWLAEYGIDGLFLQQFLGTAMCFRTSVLRNVRMAAEKYGRVFAVKFDVSGTKESDVYEMIVENWKFLVDHERITESDRYLHHKGRPLLGLWGFGFKNRPGEPGAVLQVLEWLQNTAEERYRVTVLGGIPEGWQNLTRNSKTDEAWAGVYRTFDVIHPWTVGRYKNDSAADAFHNDYTVPNVLEVHSLGKDFLPVVFPGFSWSYRNIKENTTAYTFNEVPRNGGTFLWRQMYNVFTTFRRQPMNAALYVATLDEVNEGTAIFKLGAKIPSGVNLVTLAQDGIQVPSDWYLQLVGKAKAALANNEDLPVNMPTIPQARN
jgi:hypothetical protein